jgi:hypothetical protein
MGLVFKEEVHQFIQVILTFDSKGLGKKQDVCLDILSKRPQTGCRPLSSSEKEAQLAPFNIPEARIGPGLGSYNELRAIRAESQNSESETAPYRAGGHKSTKREPNTYLSLGYRSDLREKNQERRGEGRESSE